jgi:fibro-slime domain-containing protein
MRPALTVALLCCAACDCGDDGGYKIVRLPDGGTASRLPDGGLALRLPDGGWAPIGGDGGGEGSGGGSAGGSGTGGGGSATGGGGGGGGAAGGMGGGMCTPQLVARIRDFNDTHPDFESFIGAKLGIVQSTLGTDKKPVYGPEPQTPPIVTSGQANFDQWYRDVSGVNMATTVTLPLTEGPVGHWVYDSSSFFPVDNQLFGNQGRVHNFHFTTEIHGRFVYRGGEVFNFRGDDDVWVFVNDRLALDLGGTHPATAGSIDFDTKATALGLSPNNTYTLDVFHAERHTDQSNFRVETTIDCIVPVTIN